MAYITMPLNRRARLPRMCLVCGSKDCDFERVTIRPSVGASGMVALANRGGYSTLSLTLPLCQRHRYHFTFQTILRFLTIATVIGVSLLTLALLAIFDKGWIIIVNIVVVLAVLVVAYIVSLVVNKSRVHVSGFTGDEVEFANVSAKFARVYEDQSDDDDDDNDDDDDDEERAPRRSRKTRRREEPEESDEEGDFNFDRR